MLHIKFETGMEASGSIKEVPSAEENQGRTRGVLNPIGPEA